MAKTPIEFAWIEDLLPEGEWRRKSMFGGFAYYIDEKMILLTFEGNDTKWSGALFPVDKELQPQALKQQPLLKPHSILPKWLFLPTQTESFDDVIEGILRDVLKPHSIWGSIPKPKKGAKKTKDVIDTKIDTRKPTMFSDEPADQALQKAKRVCDLKNLGTGAQAAFATVGIITAQQIIKMGWKKAMKKLVEKKPKYRHSIFAYALIGALKNTEFTQISEEEKAEARAYTKSLAPDKKAALPKKSKKAKTSKKTRSLKPPAKSKNKTSKK